MKDKKKYTSLYSGQITFSTPLWITHIAIVSLETNPLVTHCLLLLSLISLNFHSFVSLSVTYSTTGDLNFIVCRNSVNGMRKEC